MCSVHRGEHAVTTMQLVMMISPSNPPPSSMEHSPLRCHLPNCQLPLSWAASFAPPGPKPSLRSVPPLPPPTHSAEPSQTATSRPKPPLTFHNPCTLPHSRYPHSPPTHHTFLGVYSPREDLKTTSHPLRPSNKCPPYPWSLLSSHQHVVLPGACQVLVAAVA